VDYTLNTAPRPVTQTVVLDLVQLDGAAPVEAELRYDPRDPFAVTAVFMVSDRNVSWTFGRELLARGLYTPTGDGDVHVCPALDREGQAAVLLQLDSPQGGAVFLAPARDLHGFVERMKAVVQLGMEWQHTDVDSTIAAILASTDID
jgi:hypothetical protein